MPQIWYRTDEEWVVESLGPERTLGAWGAGSATMLRFRRAAGGAPGYALLADPEAVRVNGEPLLTGLRVLRDRDEILGPRGDRLWYSSERLAEVAPFVGEEDARCPRCRGGIVRGVAAVACPGCGVFYHSSEERPCFLFHDSCVICGHATCGLAEPEFGWTPCAL